MQKISSKSQLIALACGVSGVLAAVWVYWMILPGLILGAVAVVLGWRVRRKEGNQRGGVAIALGLVAILLVPSVLAQTNAAETWGRDCALDPTQDPNC
jgi:O-antigen ligase